MRGAIGEGPVDAAHHLGGGWGGLFSFAMAPGIRDMRNSGHVFKPRDHEHGADLVEPGSAVRYALGVR